MFDDLLRSSIMDAAVLIVWMVYRERSTARNMLLLLICCCKLTLVDDPFIHDHMPVYQTQTWTCFRNICILVCAQLVWHTYYHAS